MLPRQMTIGLALLAAAAGSARGQAIRYVDDDAPLGGDGVRWQTAYKYLKDALAEAAPDSSGVTEIRVAGGVYKPDQSEGGHATPGDRDATFHLLSGVSLRGGYAGLADHRHPDNRDFVLHESTLSGDLSGNDGPDFTDNEENSYHVVTASYVDETAVIDGFTITAGNAERTQGVGSGTKTETQM